jgi:hypothetical protein
MTPDNWKLVLAFGGLFLTTVTGPIMWALIAESRRVRTEIKLSSAELKTELSSVKSDLEKQMIAMEARLDQRIDTRLVHR